MGRKKSILLVYQLFAKKTVQKELFSELHDLKRTYIYKYGCKSRSLDACQGKGSVNIAI